MLNKEYIKDLNENQKRLLSEKPYRTKKYKTVGEEYEENCWGNSRRYC